MPGDPYCGNCHDWMSPMFSDAGGDNTLWVCNCTIGGQAADNTKDPNCHNSGHDHYDPKSPIVLSRQAENAAEADEIRILPLHPEPDDEGAVCGHEKVDGVCGFWGCLARAEEAEERPFFEVIDELDEILEDTNRQVDEDCLIAGHVWVRLGMPYTSGYTDSMTWGPPKCLRCGEPWPDVGFVDREGPTDRPGGEFTLPPVDERLTSYKWTGKSPVSGEDEPKHECGGCNLRDLTMTQAKKYMNNMLAWMPDNDLRREIAQWLRLDGKIRAIDVHHSHGLSKSQED